MCPTIVVVYIDSYHVGNKIRATHIWVFVLSILDVFIYYHLELEKQRKVTAIYIFFVKRRIHTFNTKNLYGNDNRKLRM
jgi:hypothetical protein